MAARFPARPLVHFLEAAYQRVVAVQVGAHAAQVVLGENLGRLRARGVQQPPGVSDVLANVLKVTAVEEVVLFETTRLLDFHGVAIGHLEKTEADLEAGQHDPCRDRHGRGKEEQGEKSKRQPRPDSDARSGQQGLLDCGDFGRLRIHS